MRVHRHQSKVLEFLLAFVDIRAVWDAEHKWFRVLIKTKKEYHRVMFILDEIEPEMPKYICPQLYQRI